MDEIGIDELYTALGELNIEELGTRTPNPLDVTKSKDSVVEGLEFERLDVLYDDPANEVVEGLGVAELYDAVDGQAKGGVGAQL